MYISQFIIMPNDKNYNSYGLLKLKQQNVD